MKRYLRNPPLLLSVLLVIASFVCLSGPGCATIEPGEDPLVVRAEQAEYTAKATFDLILNVDHSDRGFWRTNAPAFHSFCEWLRQPQTVWITNSLPRASAMILNLNAIKNAYKGSKVYSNDVISVMYTLQSIADQASAWSTIVTNR